MDSNLTEEEEMGRLFEELTLEKIYDKPVAGIYGGYMPNWDSYGYHFLYGYYGYRNRPGASDKPGESIHYKNKEGKYHRIYGPALVDKNSKIEIWLKDGKLHRIGGPAYTHKCDMFWYKEGALHRIGGPAVITDRGPKEYWIDGNKIPPKEYKREMQRRVRKNILDV